MTIGIINVMFNEADNFVAGIHDGTHALSGSCLPPGCLHTGVRPSDASPLNVNIWMNSEDEELEEGKGGMNLELQVSGRPHRAGTEIFNVEVPSGLEARHP